MSEVLTEILKVDPSFDKDRFLKQCERDIIPNVLEVRWGQNGIHSFFFFPLLWKIAWKIFLCFLMIKLKAGAVFASVASRFAQHPS